MDLMFDYVENEDLCCEMSEIVREELEHGRRLSVIIPVLNEAENLSKLLPLLDAIDQVVETVPYLNRMAWIFTFVMCKPEENH